MEMSLAVDAVFVCTLSCSAGKCTCTLGLTGALFFGHKDVRLFVRVTDSSGVWMKEGLL